MNFVEAKKYVREQLKSMGIDKLSQKELDSYTSDFLQLLKDRECSITDDSDRHSATSLSSSSISDHDTSKGTDTVIEVSMNYPKGRPPMKRKVLRKVITASADVSMSDAAVTDDDSRKVDRVAGPKSFIRPSFTHPHTRSIQKCDPVQRYHQFRHMWEAQKPPGECSRSTLRWHIREQLLQEKKPTFITHSHPSLPLNNYTAPTDKKRQKLRWEIRHQLAQH
jgi:hydrolethalus syndrome protein 1